MKRAHARKRVEQRAREIPGMRNGVAYCLRRSAATNPMNKCKNTIEYVQTPLWTLSTIRAPV